MTQQKPTSKPPSAPTSKPPTPSKPPTVTGCTEEEIKRAKREMHDAAAQTEVASKKNAEAAASLKKTISNPKMQAVRVPTPSQLELEASPSKR